MDWSVLLKPAVRRILDAMLAGNRSLTEIADATGLSKPALIPHLKALVALGVAEGSRVPTPTGSEAHYRLLDASLHLSFRASGPVAVAWAAPGPWETDVPLLPQVAQPAIRMDLARLLRAFRAREDARADRIVVILHGSGARGEATWKSDIDLLILLDEPDARVQRALEEAAFEAQMASQHAFSLTFLPRADWPSSRKRIVEEAKEEGIIVWAPGGDDAPWSTLKRYGAIML